jgi:hypothetical protein
MSRQQAGSSAARIRADVTTSFEHESCGTPSRSSFCCVPINLRSALIHTGIGSICGNLAWQTLSLPCGKIENSYK